MRGPLDVLSESWQADKQSEESVVSHILSMRDRLKKLRSLAGSNLEVAQHKQKKWYVFSQEIWFCHLQAANYWCSGKVRTAWKRVGQVDYEIEMPHRRRKRQIYHVNLLKKRESPSMLGGGGGE